MGGKVTQSGGGGGGGGEVTGGEKLEVGGR